MNAESPQTASISGSPARRRRATAAGVVGVLVIVSYAVLAACQILVLNPLAAVPGESLGQVYADLTAANEPISAAPVIAILAVGPVLAGGWALLGRRLASAVLVAAGHLTLLILGAPAYWIASFGPGMALADAYGISGADHAPWSTVLIIASAAAFAALLVLTAHCTTRLRGQRVNLPA